MMKATIKTYGCKVNQYESQLLNENLEKSGYELSDYRESEVVIVNTCCVTEKAESEARRFVRKGLQDGKRVWITGCAVRKENDFALLPGVEIFEDKEVLTRLKLAGIEGITRFFHHTRAFVKIEDGCENFCSYCIIPYVRGPVRSRNQDDIVREVENLAGNGYKEIVLTGVDIGAYGRDTFTDIVKLLDAISRVEGIKRIRISSMEVFHLNVNLVEYLAGNGLVCPHLHIPLQSGSDRILALMKRRYGVSDYLRKLDMIRKKIPHVTFTTDAMVGFPGESEEDFNLTCRAIERCGFIKVHIFRYSGRKETPAYYLGGQVPESAKKERESVLKRVAEMVSFRIKKDFIESPVEILVERKKGNAFHGYSLNYIPAFFNSAKEFKNEIVKVRVKDIKNGKLFCVAG